MKLSRKEIAEAIKQGEITISVCGLGWMGLPTACLFAEAGAKVIGVDVNRHTVELVNEGKSPIEEPSLGSLIKKHVIGKSLTATDEVGKAVSKSDVIIIVVPTIIDTKKRPDYSAVKRVCKDIGLNLRKDCLIVFESTVGPRVTETLVKNKLETASGLKAGSDFGLAYSPIRATAGRVLKDIPMYPRVVAGLDEKSTEVAIAVLGTIVKGGIIGVRDIKTAESIKLFENVYRDVNIALANELAVFCEKIGIDFKEAKEAANTQPYCRLHTPGVGVGGHCIPQNPYFLIEEAEAVGARLQSAKIARKINDRMPMHTVRLVIEALRANGKTLRRAKVAVLGVSYRADVKEARLSPSRQVIKALLKKGARVSVYDPYFSAREIKEMGYTATESLERTLENADCVLVAVGHEEFKPLKLGEIARTMRRPAALVDGCHIFDPKEVRENGFVYRGIGCGA